MNKSLHSRMSRPGLSLLETLAVVTLLGIIALIAVPRLATSGDRARANSCFTTKSMIEMEAELWFRQKGVPPQADLSDIMAAPAYFPDGIVRCPVDGSAYQLDTNTLRVTGHAHTDLVN